MIKYIKRSELDDVKYDACIENALNTRIYAYSWYLDIVADNWDALVLNDYEAVMPLPLLRMKRNFFIAKILQPGFCQQLGVFTIVKLSELNLKTFLDNFIKLKPKNYSFNTENMIPLNYSLNKKVNYELNLEREYETIALKYSKNLKRNINKAKKNSLIVSNNASVEELISIKRDCMKHQISSKKFNIITKLMNELIYKNLGEICSVTINDDIIASAFFIKSKNRIIHLFSASNELGRKYGAMSLLFDTMIKQNVNKKKVMDFEGSMIVGVAKFFESFGAEQKNYFSLKL